MGKCVTLITVRLSLTNWRKGMKNRTGVSNHARTFVGAMYEKRASDLTIDMVFTANKN